jgi:hypothetical protein
MEIEARLQKNSETEWCRQDIDKKSEIVAFC